MVQGRKLKKFMCSSYSDLCNTWSNWNWASTVESEKKLKWNQGELIRNDCKYFWVIMRINQRFHSKNLEGFVSLVLWYPPVVLGINILKVTHFCMNIVLSVFMGKHYFPMFLKIFTSFLSEWAIRRENKFFWKGC